MIPVNENLRYVFQDEVAIEDFDDGSLIFLARQKRLIEINHAARDLLRLFNGKRSLRQVIAKIVRDHKAKNSRVRKDIQELIADLGENGVVKPLVKLRRRRKKIDKSASLLANPKISLREEEGGAILFNLETDDLQVINPIGLLVIKFIQVHPRTRSDISKHLLNTCKSVPADQVEKDVDGFVTKLQGRGFIKEVENNK